MSGLRLRALLVLSLIMFRIAEDDRWLLLPKGFILFIGLFCVLLLEHFYYWFNIIL